MEGQGGAWGVYIRLQGLHPAALLSLVALPDGQVAGPAAALAAAVGDPCIQAPAHRHDARHQGQDEQQLVQRQVEDVKRGACVWLAKGPARS